MIEKIENFDVEAELYKVLDKCQKLGVYNCINSVVTKSAQIYVKRFGDVGYANSIPEDQFVEEMMDCVYHVLETDVDGQKLLEVINTEVEQEVLLSAIYGLLSGMRVDCQH